MTFDNFARRCALVLALALGSLANQHAQAQLQRIGAEEAAHVANGHIVGKVVRVVRKRDLGVWYFVVAIRAGSGLVYDVYVAIDNGRVSRILLSG